VRERGVGTESSVRLSKGGRLTHRGGWIECCRWEEYLEIQK